MKRKLISLVLLIILVACQSTSTTPKIENPEPEPATEPISLSVTLEPLGPVLTNANLNFVATVTGGVADKVELFLDDVLLSALSKPELSFLWDVSNVPEGSYTLKAVASLADKTFTSDDLSVTLDKTAPTIVSRTPEIDATDVAADAAIVIGFSEPVLAVSEASVIVTASYGSNFTQTATLNEAGDELSITLSGITAPEIITLELKDLRDAAGNTLSETWSWTVPAEKLEPTPAPTGFSDLGSGTALSVASASVLGERPVSLAADNAGNAVVAFNDNGSTKLSTLAGSLSLTTLDTDAAVDSLPSVALLSNGNPVVAWRNGEDNAETLAIEASGIEVRRWNGSSWDDLGQVNSSLEASAPSLAVADDDSIYVAYHESDGVQPNVVVAKFNTETSSWDALGTILDTSPDAIAVSPALTITNKGLVVVAWFEVEGETRTVQAKQFDGSSWVAMGDVLNVDASAKADMVSLAAGPDGLPVLAWHERVSANDDRIYVKKWDGSAWLQLGDALDRPTIPGAQYPDVTVDATNVISVVWFESLETSGFEDNSVLLAQWRNDAWQEIAKLDTDTPNISQAYFPSVAILGETQKPIVAWVQDDSSEFAMIEAVQAD